jgi:hypothetical protein
MMMFEPLMATELPKAEAEGNGLSILRINLKGLAEYTMAYSLPLEPATSIGTLPKRLHQSKSNLKENYLCHLHNYLSLLILLIRNLHNR